MKRILFLILFGIVCQLNAAPAFVNYTSAMFYPATSGTTTLNNVAAGNLIVVAVRLSTTGSSTVTGGGIAWTKSVDVVNNVGLSLQIHSGVAVSSGNLPVTITVSGGSTSIRHVILQYTGIASSSYIVASAQASGDTGNGIAGPITATADNLLFCAVGTDSDLQGWVAGSGFTFRDTPNQELEPDQKLATADRIVSSGGSYTGSTTMVKDSWVAGVVAFASDSLATAQIGVSPSSFDYGTISADTNKDVTFTVTNAGTATLTGSASTSLPFSILSGSPYSIPPKSSSKVTVRFSPTAAGSSSKTVTFTGGSGASVSVTGVATNDVPPPPTNLRIVSGG